MISRTMVAAVSLSACILLLAFDVQDEKNAGAKQDAPELSGINIKNEMKNCAKCHMDVMEEWQASRHAKSWTSPVFQAAIAKLPDKGESCARCHAPDSVPLAGMGKLPNARPDYREFGVNCTTCHMDGKKYFGPYASKGHGGIMVDPAYLKADFCSSCHGQPEVNKAHDQWTSYLQSPSHLEDGKSCQSCHMPQVTRKMVKSRRRLRKNVQPARKCRTHSFEGAHTSDKAEDAADVTASLEGGKLKVEIDPYTGHSLPASEGREVRLAMEFFDAAGKSLHTASEVWDYAKKKVLMPGRPNVVEVKAPAGTVKATARLDLVFVVVPGREKEHVVPIGEDTAEP